LVDFNDFGTNAQNFKIQILVSIQIF
jgi:hypothetical protein